MANIEPRGKGVGLGVAKVFPERVGVVWNFRVHFDDWQSVKIQKFDLFTQVKTKHTHTHTLKHPFRFSYKYNSHRFLQASAWFQPILHIIQFNYLKESHLNAHMHIHSVSYVCKMLSGIYAYLLLYIYLHFHFRILCERKGTSVRIVNIKWWHSIQRPHKWLAVKISKKISVC